MRVRKQGGPVSTRTWEESDHLLEAYRGGSFEQRSTTMTKTTRMKNSKKAGATKVGTKVAQVVGPFSCPSGASITEMMKSTGWQAQSVQGFLAGSLKKKGHGVASELDEGGGDPMLACHNGEAKGSSRSSTQPRGEWTEPLEESPVARHPARRLRCAGSVRLSRYCESFDNLSEVPSRLSAAAHVESVHL